LYPPEHNIPFPFIFSALTKVHKRLNDIFKHFTVKLSTDDEQILAAYRVFKPFLNYVY